MPTIDPDHPARAARTFAGLTQADVAERAGVSGVAITQAERRGDGVTVRALRRLCEAMGLMLEIRVKRL